MPSPAALSPVTSTQSLQTDVLCVSLVLNRLSRRPAGSFLPQVVLRGEYVAFILVGRGNKVGIAGSCTLFTSSYKTQLGFTLRVGNTASERGCCGAHPLYTLEYSSVWRENVSMEM